MKKQEPHRHSFNKLGWEREFQTNLARGNKLVPDPDPKDVDRIILFHQCKCGVKQAFECGSADDMRKLYAKLTKGKQDGGY